MHIKENIIMDTGSIIELPPDLFAAIDNAHKKATAIYNSMDKQALALIDPNRLKKDEQNKNLADKIKHITQNNETTPSKKKKI